MQAPRAQQDIDALFASLMADRFDVVANQVTKNAEREAKYALSQPYTFSTGVIITRTDGAASPMPEGEDLATLGKSGATLAIHLSIRNIHKVVAELTPHYGADCPVVVVFRVGWPDQEAIFGTLGDIKGKVKETKITRTALIMVGRVFGARDFEDSRLYHADHRHILRPKKKA